MKTHLSIFLLSLFQLDFSLASCPNIVSRSDWGAKPPRSSTPMRTPVGYVIIHHSETGTCSSRDSCSMILRNIQHDHMHNRSPKAKDIGYSFLVGGDGEVFQGRGWDKVGGHAHYYNSKSIGIALIGSFQSARPTDAQLTAVKQLIECGVSQGKLKSAYKLLGHCQTTATDCQEQLLFKIIKTWPHWHHLPVCPSIACRSDWGAKPPRSSTPLRTPVDYVIIHSTETDTCSTRDSCSMILRNIQHDHMHNRSPKAKDIGYSFLVGGDGEVFQGRGWDKVGSHAHYYNSKSIGIALIGRFQSARPTDAQLTATKQLIECGVSQGKLKSDYKLLEHCQTTATDCPGQIFSGIFKTWPHWHHLRK